MAIDLAVRPSFEYHLRHRYRGEAECAEAADRRLLEQQGGAADGDQVQECLMDLDREVGAIEMGLHGLRDEIERFGQDTAFQGTDFPPRDQTEP